MQNLCERVLVDVRLRAGIPQHRERVLVSELIEETQVSAAIDANVRGLELIVPEVEPGLAIDADRQILAAAVASLLQNAFKFTRSHSRVSLKTFSSARLDRGGGRMRGPPTRGCRRSVPTVRAAKRRSIWLGSGPRYQPAWRRSERRLLECAISRVGAV